MESFEKADEFPQPKEELKNVIAWELGSLTWGCKAASTAAAPGRSHPRLLPGARKIADLSRRSYQPSPARPECWRHSECGAGRRAAQRLGALTTCGCGSAEQAAPRGTWQSFSDCREDPEDIVRHLSNNKNQRLRIRKRQRGEERSLVFSYRSK